MGREVLRTGRDVEQLWEGLRECMVEETEAVCGRTKGLPRHKETWWWNEEVKEAVDEKRRLFLVWKDSRPKDRESNHEAYRKANKLAKAIIYKAKDTHRLEWRNRRGKRGKESCMEW